jgi:hypothetical protein
VKLFSGAIFWAEKTDASCLPARGFCILFYLLTYVRATKDLLNWIQAHLECSTCISLSQRITIVHSALSTRSSGSALARRNQDRDYKIFGSSMFAPSLPKTTLEQVKFLLIGTSTLARCLTHFLLSLTRSWEKVSDNLTSGIPFSNKLHSITAGTAYTVQPPNTTWR